MIFVLTCACGAKIEVVNLQPPAYRHDRTVCLQTEEQIMGTIYREFVTL